MNGPPDHKILSRDELYEMVWTKSVQDLARDFGISGRGLSKICARLNVPVPPRGYWAKRAAGKRAIKYKLPAPKSDTPLNVTISPTSEPELLPDRVVNAVAEARHHGIFSRFTLQSVC